MVSTRNLISPAQKETSKRASKRKQASQLQLQENLQVAEQSPQDGPSLFQRSNSSRSGNSGLDRTATVAAANLIKLSPASCSSDDDNSEECKAAESSAKPAAAAFHLKPEPVGGSSALHSSSLHSGSSSNPVSRSSVAQMADQTGASKREIKQINVLKGKSSPFNITIKARETQLIKNPIMHHDIPEESLRKFLLPICPNNRSPVRKFCGGYQSPNKKLFLMPNVEI